MTVSVDRRNAQAWRSRNRASSGLLVAMYSSEANTPYRPAASSVQISVMPSPASGSPGSGSGSACDCT